MRTNPTLRADKPAHVLYDSNDRQLDLLAKVDFLSNVEQSNLLWSRDDDSTVGIRFFQVLGDRKMLIRSSWRGVDNEIVQFVPVNIFQELLYKS